MRYLNRKINVQLIMIICLITVGVNVNYIFTNDIDRDDSLQSTLLSGQPQYELIQTSRAISSKFHWGKEQVVSEPVPGMDVNSESSKFPAIVLENGIMHLVWSDSNDTKGAGTDSDIFYKYNNGHEWSEVFVVSELVQGQDNNGGQSTRPDIAVENGEVYITWLDYSNVYGSGTDADIFYRHFNGTAWSGITVVSEPSQGSNLNTGLSLYPRIDVENSTVHVVWGDNTQLNGAGPDMDVFYRVNKNGNWLNTNIVSEPVQGLDINKGVSFEPGIDVEDNIVHVIWSDTNNTNGASNDPDIFYRYHNGISWSGAEIVSEPTPGNNLNDDGSFWPDIAVENDDVYVVWEDESNIHQADFLEKEICYRHRSQSDWSGIEVVSEPVAGSNYNIENSDCASVTVENGSVHVVWVDENNTDGASPGPGFPDEDIFYRWLEGDGGGGEWSRIKVLSEPIQGQDINKGPSAESDIVVWHRKVNVVWSDYNNTNGSGTDTDIFYRTTFVAPALSGGNITPSIGLTNTTFTYSVNYSDADNELPTFIRVNINGTNHQMQELNQSDTDVFDGKRYFYKTTLNISTTHNFRFRASDGSYEVQTRLFNEPVVFNTAPVIEPHDNLTVTEDLYFEEQHYFTDLDNWQSHFWELQTNTTSWLELDSPTGTISGTPTNAEVGTWWVNLTLTDELGAKDHINFTIEVVNVNDAPVITNTDQDVAYEDKLYEVLYQGYDIDRPRQNLTWTFDSNTTRWLGFNHSSFKLSGTPANDEFGVYWVNISLSDGLELDHTNFTLTVINTNDPPVIISEDVLTATATFLYSAHYEAYDIDPPPQDLVWNLSTNASSWLDINPKNGWLYGIPLKKHVGWFWVNVSVWDIEQAFDFNNFTITVNPSPNKAPKINFTNVSVTAVTGEEYVFKFNGSDDRTPRDELYWNLTTNGSWLMLDRETGNLSGTPTLTDVGWCWVNVSLHDNENESSYFNFTIYVTIPWVDENSPPVLRNGEVFPPMDGYERFIFIVQYYDENGDRPTRIEVVIDNSSHQMWFVAGDPANGEYEFHTDLTGGIYTYYFVASDGEYTVRTENYTTEVPIEDDGSETDDNTFVIILGVLIVVIIIVIIFFILIRFKRQVGFGNKEEDETEDELEDNDDVGSELDQEPEGGKSKDDKIKGKISFGKRAVQSKRMVKTPVLKVQAIKAPKSKPLAVKKSMVPILFKSETKMSCNVCLGSIKKDLPTVKCSCGKTYHRSCANRAVDCPNCGTKLLNPKSKLD